MKGVFMPEYIDSIMRTVKESHHKNIIYHKFIKAYFMDDESDLVLLKLQYMQDIVKEMPSFMLARKEIVRLFKLANNKITSISSLALQVKNYINEMREFHKENILEDEEIEYSNILKQIDGLIKKTQKKMNQLIKTVKEQV